MFDGMDFWVTLRKAGESYAEYLEGRVLLKNALSQVWFMHYRLIRKNPLISTI